LFCDLRGFTGFTESADAEDVMALLRDYHAAIGEIIIKYNGTLERYAGDGVMVVFNDPVPVENPALEAVLMAIGALTETWRRWGHDISFGIGIAHGFATLGTIGFEGRFDYAAIGTVSNVASRLPNYVERFSLLVQGNSEDHKTREQSPPMRPTKEGKVRSRRVFHIPRTDVCTEPVDIRASCALKADEQRLRRRSSRRRLLIDVNRSFSVQRPSFSATIFSTLKIAIELANAVSALPIAKTF
jgi:hypothetical protein